MYLYFLKDMKRAFISWKMICSVVASIVATFIAIFTLFLWVRTNDVSLLYIFFSSYNYGTTTFLMILFPLISCLPFATSLLEDSKNGIQSLIRYRISKAKYFSIRFIVNAIAGAVTVVVGPVLLVITLMIIHFTYSTNWLMDEPISSILFFNKLGLTSPYSMISVVLLTLFICGALFATIGLVCSLVIKNTYIAWIFPFVLFVFSGTVLNAISEKFYLLRIYDFSYSNSSVTSTILLILALFIICIGFYSWKVKTYDEEYI